MRSLYQDLRDPPTEHVQLIYHDTEHEVITNGDQGPTVQPAAPSNGTLLWLRPGQTAGAGATHLIEVGAKEGEKVICRQYLSTQEEVQQALHQLWMRRWNARPTPTREDWQRIMDFFRHMIPQLRLTLPPITASQWRRTLRKYHQHAARGADGVSHLDLIHMPDSHLDTLLAILRRIEEGTQPWPAQVLRGICLALAKSRTALSLVYRTWSAIRAKQLIRHLLPHIPAQETGFIPERETSQVWMHIQANIEIHLQTHAGLNGLSTDLCKAFNTISRPLHRLARPTSAPHRP